MEPGLFIFLFIISAVISYVVLYYVIKYAVKNAILEAHWEINNSNGNDEDIANGGDVEYIVSGGNSGIAKIICPYCGRKYDMDYPKCPHCGHGREVRV